MKLTHIFLFTICVVLPNGLYSSAKTSQEERMDRFNMVNSWRKTFEKYCPFESMKKIHIFIKVMTVVGSPKNALFVVEEDRIGVNITSPTDGVIANYELTHYLGDVLGIKPTDIKIVSGFAYRMKTFKLAPRILTVRDVTERIIKRLIEQKLNLF